MKKSFGIISGAGPMAGVLLYRKTIELLQAKGAWQDSDFPKIILINIPFIDMLDNQENDGLVRRQLLESLEALYTKVDNIYIACQTLHAYLTPDEIVNYKVISLLSLIKKEIYKTDKPILVVASSTSRRLNLHYLINSNIQYIDPESCDKAIKTILRGFKPKLNWIIEKTFTNTIVLGCTEFSVACEGMGFQWIDPIHLAALDMVKKFNF